MGSKVAGDLEPWHRLDSKIVLVTGASAGLGREFCLDLANAGCKIIAAARRIDKLSSLCEEINRKSAASSVDSARAVAVELDVTADAPTIEAAVQRAWGIFGHIDVLINNAGMRGNVHLSIDLPEDEWDTVVKTNLTGAWLVARYTGRLMRAAGRGGSIINISSIAALPRVYMPGGVAYNSSKTGLDSMTKIMAIELGEFNIRVNSIAPGFFPSEITGDLLQKQWMKNVVERTVPLRTLGTTDPALTSIIRFLIHDSSSYVAGNVFIVDSGSTLPGFPIFSSL